jgi:MraZ protein
VFLGEYRHSLDDKGRVTVPIRLREELSPVLFLTRGHDTNLILFPQEAWDELGRRLGQMPTTSHERRVYTRWIMGGATETSLDKAGRILVPMHLRGYAEIDGEVVFVGADDVIEIWSPARWQMELAQYKSEIKSVISHVSQSGV